MPIKLIDEKESLVWTFPKDKEVKIFYRRVPDSLRKQWREELGDAATAESIGEKALEYAIIGWTGFEDQNGKPVPFSLPAFYQVPDGISKLFIAVLLDGTKTEQSAEGKAAKN
jgi:hypothetical protein